MSGCPKGRIYAHVPFTVLFRYSSFQRIYLAPAARMKAEVRKGVRNPTESPVCRLICFASLKSVLITFNKYEQKATYGSKVEITRGLLAKLA